jgi:hypothetical protein
MQDRTIQYSTDNIIQYNNITQNNINAQDNPLYSKLQTKKNQEHINTLLRLRNGYKLKQINQY